MSNIKKAQDSSALKDRLDINKKYSKNDLNDWIFSLFNLSDSGKILDFCCGRGNQTFRFAEKYKGNTVYAVDISQESLNVISKKNYKNIETILMSIDSFPSVPIKKDFFDVVHCAYGLYYAKNPKEIIVKAHKLLKDGGIFIVVGPTGDNNNELYNFIEKVYPIDKDIIFTSRDFMNKVVVPESERIFLQVDKYYFTNQVVYPSVQSFYEYFKSSTMYKKKYDKEIKKIINKYFKNNKKFVITKKAMAVIAKK